MSIFRITNNGLRYLLALWIDRQQRGAWK